MNLRTVQLLDFEAAANDGFVDWMTINDCSVLLSHSNKLISCGRDTRGEFVTDHVLFDRVTGLSVGADNTMWVASQHELWSLTDGLGLGELSPTGADRWMMCRTARFVGGVRPADLAPVGDDCWFVSVTLSAVCSLDQTFSAKVQWVPPFISAVRPEMRCRLTGLGIRDGLPTVVTSVSTADIAGGWTGHRVDGGVLVDITSNEILASGLSMPHSPRWYNDAWWLVQAGTGELGFIDDGKFVAVCRIDGFTRGLTIHADTALVGGSGSRWDELVEGLPVGDRLKTSGGHPASGVFMFDLRSGRAVGEMRLDGTAREVSDVAVLAGTRVEMSGPHGAVAQDWTTFPTDFDPSQSLV
jgi:uncharacterized protein (TIGR03032 family)